MCDELICTQMLLPVFIAFGAGSNNNCYNPELCAFVCRCDEVICSQTEDIAARVKAITGGAGAAAVIDSVGGALSQSLGAAVRDGGTVWLYGLMDGLTFTASGVDCLFR